MSRIFKFIGTVTDESYYRSIPTMEYRSKVLLKYARANLGWEESVHVKLYQDERRVYLDEYPKD